MNTPTSPSASRPRVALIAGPTASGKSAVAMALAELVDGVVINADATQVYRELRVLSARPSVADEQRVPHRLFGYLDGAIQSSAARWAEAARDEIDHAVAAGRLPILVGGTGLYLRTLIEGIAPVPPIAPAIREEVRAMPVAAAYARLATLDSAAAARLGERDTARVARALEVILSTGRSLAKWQTGRVGGIADTVDLAPVILLPDREGLLARIDERSASMMAEGAIEEVEAILGRDDLPPSSPVRKAIGVPEIARLVSGECTFDEALSAIRLATRRYAKRQYTWFRHQPPPEWSRIETIDLDRLKYYFRIWP